MTRGNRCSQSPDAGAAAPPASCSVWAQATLPAFGPVNGRGAGDRRDGSEIVDVPVRLRFSGRRWRFRRAATPPGPNALPV